MKKILLLSAFLFASCGKQTDLYITETSPDNSEKYVTTFSNYNLDCTFYKSHIGFKRANSKLKMDVDIIKNDTTILNFEWKKFLKLERTEVGNFLKFNDIVVAELENGDFLELEIVVKNGVTVLHIEDQKIELDVEFFPENIVYCHPDNKVVNSIEILDAVI